MPTVRTATGLIAWYMRACGFAGSASFWRTIYVLPGHENNERLLRQNETRLWRVSTSDATWNRSMTGLTAFVLATGGWWFQFNQSWLDFALTY